MERRSWRDQVPLLAAWRNGGAAGLRGSTRLFYAAFAALSVWMALVPVLPGVTATVMRHFHLTSGNYLLWLPQQVIPAMYSFANEYRMTPKDLPLEAGEVFAGSTWVNHYPPRLFTFERRRGLAGEEFYVYCRSRYRGRELLSKMRVEREEGGGFRMSVIEERFAAP